MVTLGDHTVTVGSCSRCGEGFVLSRHIVLVIEDMIVGLTGVVWFCLSRSPYVSCPGGHGATKRLVRCIFHLVLLTLVVGAPGAFCSTTMAVVSGVLYLVSGLAVPIL